MANDQTTQSAPTERSGSGALLGAMATMMGLSVLLQVAILVLLIIVVMRPGSQQEQPGTAASSETGSTPRQPTVGGSPTGSPASADLRIRPARELPRTMPEAERALVWYTAGDELFAVESTLVDAGGALPGVATVRVHGRGVLSVDDGQMLFPGSRVRVDRVMDGRVVVSTGEDSKEILTPGGQGGIYTGRPRQIGGNEEAPPPAATERSRDPRVVAAIEALRNQANGQPTTDAPSPPTTPITPELPAGYGPGGLPLGKPVVMTYPARDWQNFITEMRLSLTRDVMARDSFDERFRPNGVELTTFLHSIVLFEYLKIQEGDRVTSVDGRPVRTTTEFSQAFLDGKFEQSVRLTVVRDGKEVEVRVDKFPQS